MSALATADELAAEAPDPDDYEWPESAEGDDHGEAIWARREWFLTLLTETIR
jgi:hypothetical protein